MSQCAVFIKYNIILIYYCTFCPEFENYTKSMLQNIEHVLRKKLLSADFASEFFHQMQEIALHWLD